MEVLGCTGRHVFQCRTLLQIMWKHLMKSYRVLHKRIKVDWDLHGYSD